MGRLHVCGFCYENFVGVGCCADFEWLFMCDLSLEIMFVNILYKY